MNTAVFFLSLGVFCFFGWKHYQKIKDVPLHSDSAEFLLPGLVRSLGQVFEPYRSFNFTWWDGSVFSFFKRMKKQVRLSFPPAPYCEIHSEKPLMQGGNPVIQQKCGVYGFYSVIGAWFGSQVHVFRLIQTVIVVLNAVMLSLILRDFVPAPLALLTGLLSFGMYVLPHFDNHQIHAELYGCFLLNVLVLLIFSQDVQHMFQAHPLVLGTICGALLCVTVLFVKVTFVLPAALFCLYPLAVNVPLVSWHVFLGTLWAGSCILVIFAFTPYFAKLIEVNSPLNLWRYKQSIPTLHPSGGREPAIDSKGPKEDVVWSERVRSFFYGDFGKIFTALTVICLAITLGTGYLFIEPFNPLYVLAGLWLTMEMVTVKIQGKYYPAHFTPLVFPFFLCFGLLLGQATGVLTGASAGTASLTVSVGVVTAGVFILAVSSYLCVRFILGKKKLDYFLAPYLSRRNPYVVQLLAAPVVGRAVQISCGEDRRIFVFGYASTVYLYARRRPALEFMESSLGVDPDIADSVWGESWPWWVCRDIHKFTPALIVDMDGRLDIGEVNRATGMVYTEEYCLMGCFTVYRLSDVAGRYTRYGPCLKPAVVSETSERYEQQKKISCLFCDCIADPRHSMPDELNLLLGETAF